MKKFITLVLALVLVFGLAVPAMAFTSDTTEKARNLYDLSIYLVEYDDNDLFGYATLPESDRGYAKNEIVAAVVELYVPKGEKVASDYGALKFGGDNVSLDVTDNDIKTTTADYQLRAVNITGDVDTFILNSDGDELSRTITTGDLYNPDKNKTYKWLFFGKVTDDDASLYAKLVDMGGNSGAFSTATPSTLTVAIEGNTYTVTKVKTSDDVAGTYTITRAGKAYSIIIDVDKKYKSTGMTIDLNGSSAGQAFALGVDVAGELGVIDPTNAAKFLDTDDADYKSVMDIYDDIVVDVFGLDYMLIGNYVRDSFWTDLVSPDTIIATVDIEPWTAYVTVPDNIVVDPPKTGDAASIMGFVMVALSGAGAVALKKRG